METEFLDRVAVCRLIGGNRPIHAATLYRGIRKGHYPRPVKVGPGSSRWLLSEVVTALQTMVAGRAVR
jgi:predicted DNA-binding transcriptional regulator AlpA